MYTGKILRNKIIKDPLKVYEEIHKLIIQAFYVEFVRQKTKERRYKLRVAKNRNSIDFFSHVALENYSIIQLWKLFDHKSIFNTREVIKYVPYTDLKSWFDEEIKSIAGDIKNLDIWRHNFVGHRLEFGYFAPEVFERRFKNINEIINQKIQPFLIMFLFKLRSEVKNITFQTSISEIMKELSEFNKALK